MSLRAGAIRERVLPARLRDLEDDFPRLARSDRADRLVGFLQRKAMRDDRRGIELTGEEEARHLVPGIVHATPDHAVDGDPLEDHFPREIDLHRLRRNTEHL